MKALFIILMVFVSGTVIASGQSFTVGAPIEDGLNDMALAEMTYIGLAKAQKELGIRVLLDVGFHDTITEKKRQEAFQRLIDKKVDLIVMSGWQYVKSLKKFAKFYPDQRFLINGVPIDLPNVTSISFSQHEGSYLAGVLAGFMTRTNKIGFIGGVDIPVIHAFRIGFEEGLKYANPKVVLDLKFISGPGDFKGFNNPEKGREIALGQIRQGSDIIFAVAGQSNDGIILAAQDKKKFVIGVDSDQDHRAKGFVLTSMMKRIDISTFKEISRILKGEFKPGIQYYGLKKGGVSLSPMKYTKHLVPPGILENLKEVESKIVSGEIKVTN